MATIDLQNGFGDKFEALPDDSLESFHVGSVRAAIEAARQAGREEMRRACLVLATSRHMDAMASEIRALSPGGVEAGEGHWMLNVAHAYGCACQGDKPDLACVNLRNCLGSWRRR